MLREAKHVRDPSPRLAVPVPTRCERPNREEHLFRTSMVHYHAPYQSGESCEVRSYYAATWSRY